MKNFKNLSKIVAILSIAFLVFSCSDDDDVVIPVPTESIVSLAVDAPQLSSLEAALTKFPDLVDLLSSDGAFTVFAPDDNAFANFLTTIGQTDIDDVPEDVLKSVLQYHVFASAALPASAVSTGSIEMANGEMADVVADASGVSIANAQVTAVDILATNGVVHIVDSVMVPPSILPVVGTIVAPAYFNKNFSTLIAAVQNADTDVLSFLLTNGPSGDGLTLFAPTNAAFEAAGVTDVNGADAVLTYHVVDGTVMSGDLPVTSGSAAAVPTVGGSNIYITNAGDGVFINGTTEVTSPNISGSNGVVHVIDRTLLPPTNTINEIVASLAGGDPAEFTLLAAALSRAGLGTFFDGDGPYTVFAPTDAAFNAAGFADADAINAAPVDAVAGILTHHVVEPNAFVFSTDLSSGAVPMLNGQNVTINLSDLTVQDAAGTTPPAGLVTSLLNVLATNGVVHVIDAVLLPAS